MITQFVHGEDGAPRKVRAKVPGLRAGILAVSALLLTLAGPLVGAQTVSVNFVGGYGGNTPANMDPTEVAGVLPVANWNQAVGGSGTLTPLVDSTGATATGLSVTWTSPNTWANGVNDTPGNVRLMKGYLDTGGNGSAPAATSFSVSGLSPTSTYSVYVYATGANTGRSGIYSIGNQTFYLADNGVADGSSFTQATSTVAASPTTANYVVFTVSNQASFTVTATPDAAGGGGFRSPMNGFQLVKVVFPPAAPTGLAATAADSTAYLTWNPSSGAATYNVLRGAKTGGPYTSIATGVVSPTYTDTGLTNGTTYYYVVQAVNKNGTSVNSNEAPATPVAAVVGNGTVSVNFVGGNGTVIPTPMAPAEVAGVAPVANWNNALTAGGSMTGLTDSSGAPVSASITWSGSPNVWASTIGDTPGNNRLMEGYLDTGNTTTTSITLSGLSPAKTYFIYLYSAGDATGHAGVYSLNNQSFAMATGAFGGTFIQGTATDPLNPTFGNYVVFQASGQASYTVNATPTVNGFRAPVNGVQVVVVTPPTAPANLAAVGLDSSIFLSWNGVAVATSYNIKRSLTGLPGSFTSLATGVLGASYTDSTVTNGTKYYYVVDAVNAVAVSSDSNVASATPIAAVVGTGNGLYGAYYTPGNADFSAETTGTLVFSDVVPVVNFNGGNAYTAYNPLPWPSGIPATQFTAVWTGQVLAPYTGSYQFQTITDDGARLTVNGTVLFSDMLGHGPTANTGAAVNLTAGTKYPITFEYVQGGGGRTAQLLYSPLGAPFQIIPQSQLSTVFTTAPNAPTNLIAVGHNKSVQLYWNAGLNSAAFNIKRSLKTGGPYTTIATGVTANSYLDTGLTNGVTYYYVVSGTNSIGESSNSNEAFALTSGAFNPIAYWHFDEGAVGTMTAFAPAQIPDATGKGNTLQTPEAGAAPTYAASIPGNPTTPAYTNLLSLDFSAAPGLNTSAAANYPARYLDTTGATGDINTHTFNQFTIEASFNTTAIGTSQTIVGKDGGLFLGDPNAANSALYFQLSNNVISLQAHQGDQTFVQGFGTTVLTTNHWYNAVGVSDGYYLSLYLQSTPGGAYNLESVVPFTGMLFDGQGKPFSVGRGFFNNLQTDRFLGLIDEVRISDTALDPSQFLFAPAPAVTGATLTGTVTLEGVGDITAVNAAAPLGTFHVIIETAGTSTVIKTADVTLTGTPGSPNGTFTLSGVPAGTYDVLIKGNKNLATKALGVVVGASSGTVGAAANPVNLRAGDANNDNSVDSTDFGLLIGAFNTAASRPGSGYDPTVDFNFDGSVDSTDFGLLIGEFNIRGDM